MIVQIAEVSQQQQLQGRLLGKKHFARICEQLADTAAGEIVLLDFQGVELITGSWVNAVMVPLLRWAAEEQNNLFPIICELEEMWLDDLRLVAQWNHQCYLVAPENSRPPERATLVGSLDRGQRTTLEAVLRSGEATGAKLERERPGQRTKATAWNNRLKDLFAKRLLQREKRGREQVYSPVVREIEFNG